MKRTRSIALGVLVVFLLSGTAAWARKSYSLTAGQGVPAASGKVEVNKDKNGNTEVVIKVERLAQAGVLTPPATAYVIWFQEPNAEPMSQGQLEVGKNLKGEYKTATRLRKFDVFVTAEDNPLTKAPMGQVVLKATVEGS